MSESASSSGSARDRFVTEFSELCERSGLSAEAISQWIRNHRDLNVTVSPKTIGDWIKPTPTVPRDNEKFLAVVRCLYAETKQTWDGRAIAKWTRLRSRAYDESRQQAVPEPEQLAGTRAVVVGPVPRRPNHFVLRDELVRLQAVLHDEQLAVVTGMRGAGKTHIAAAYARDVLESEPTGVLVGWVNAESVAGLHTDLAEVAEYLGVAADDRDPAKSAKRLRDHLNNCSDRHLLVLDNATDPDDLYPVLPIRGGTRIVITTTNKAMTRLTSNPDEPIDAGGGYTLEQARTYLQEATGITDDPDGEKDLAEELGRLPLALAVAAAAIRPSSGPRLTYPAYLDKLRAQRLPRALRRRDGSTDYPLSVDQAIMLSVNAVTAATDDNELDEVVRWLLGLFAVLAPSGVRRELLFHPDPTLNELVDEAIERCVDHCLLSWSTNSDQLAAHRLTARVLLEHARDTDHGDQILANVLPIMEPRLFDHEHAWERRHEGAHLVDQIESIWASKLFDQAHSKLRDRGLRIRIWGLQHLIETVRLERAIPVGEEMLSFCTEQLGPDHAHTLKVRDQLGQAYRIAGRPEDAIPLFEYNCGSYERLLGAEDPHTLHSRDELAHAYRSAGKVGEAVALHEKNREVRTRALGADHPDTLHSRHLLADSYRSLGRYAEAIDLHEQNCADYERVLGPDHPDTLRSRDHLAHAYRGGDRLDEAIALYERTFTDYENALGADHPDTLRSRDHLAFAYGLKDRTAEAIELHEQNLIDRKKILGDEHPHTLRTRHNLADALRSQGRLAEAIELFERNLADRTQILGPLHAHTLISQNALADAYLQAERIDDAVALHEKNLADRERVLSPEHPNILNSRHNLAVAYEAAGRFEEAIEQYEQALAGRERRIGSDHSRTRDTRNRLTRLRNRLSPEH